MPNGGRDEAVNEVAKEKTPDDGSDG